MKQAAISEDTRREIGVLHAYGIDIPDLIKVFPQVSKTHIERIAKRYAMRVLSEAFDQNTKD